MKKYDLYGGFFWLAISAGVGALAIRLVLGTIRRPGRASLLSCYASLFKEG
jgi:hypothetical protein